MYLIKSDVPASSFLSVGFFPQNGAFLESNVFRSNAYLDFMVLDTILVIT